MTTEKEKQLLTIIRQNPFLSQQDIAKEMGMPRSTIAGLISSLVQKNLIKGRAYILNDRSDIVCIGGMNIDRKFQVTGDLMLKTSNPVTSSVSVGGVARNIAENLGRLNEKVTLLSVAGYDHDFEWIKEQSSVYINMDQITQLSHASTGQYSAVLDRHGEMVLALANMSIYDEMDSNWIKRQESFLAQAKLILLDLNIPYKTVEHLIQFAKQKHMPLYIIPVSSPKMNRLPQSLDGVDTVIVNRDESETFFESPDKSSEDLIDCWLNSGVNQVILTSGSQATFYGHQNGERLKFHPPKIAKVADVTGAGDSFVAGFIFGQTHHFSSEESIQLGMTNAYHTIQSTHTVRQNLNEVAIFEEKKLLF